ncbi:ribonuclease HII [Natrialbaceae archaeon A-gly3]
MPFGVDEAGKGPVFGSMFAAAVYVKDESRLPDGLDDSKKLSSTRRQEFATALRGDDGISIGLAEVPVSRIDDSSTDMNTLTVDAHAEAIDEAVGETTGDLEAPAGLCDACDTDADRFARRVAENCPSDVTVEARHGADAESPVVAAASIIAKVARDAHVAAIADEYGDVGSGYPGDRTTRTFLESYVDQNGELPPFARASWSTCADVLAAANQTGLGDFS